LEIETTEESPGVRADHGMLEQVIVNLAVNARDAMGARGQLRIRTSTVTFRADDPYYHPSDRLGRFACLSVTDTGCGIAPEIIPRLFEPFFTTKKAGEGTGLGLATVYGIVRQHEGWIEVESECGKGTTFKIFLPEFAKPETGMTTKVVSTVASGGQETILLVEDEVAVRDVAQLVLQEKGYRVYSSDSGLDALRRWPDYGAEIDLLLTDIVMPGGVSGRELARCVQRAKPGLKVLFSTGYSAEISDANGTLEEGLNLLSKPYTPERLAAIVRDCLDRVLPAV
jgi:CheY-like chemotaxis protein